jgi:hypothetical protein
MKHAAVLLGLATLTACGATGPSESEPRVYTIEVLPSTQDCMGWAYPWPCLNVREEPDGELHGLLDGIEGFAYQWGHQYRLEIAEYIISDPPQDGSSRRYELRRILEDELIPVGTQFSYLAWAESRSILRKDAGNINFFLGVTVPCGEDCAAIGAAIDAQHRFELTLQHTGITATPLALVDWASCPATANPSQCDP